MSIKKFKEYKINEGIDSSVLNDEQKEALDELKTSDTTLFNGQDYWHYANKIGVGIEDIIEFIADGGTSTDTDSDYIDETDELFRNRLQSDIIDNPKVDNVNLMIKIEELADDLYMDIHGDYDMDYKEILNKLNSLYKEMTHDPSQVEMDFQSKNNNKDMKIKKFNENWEPDMATEEQKEDNIVLVSNILNDTGAYNKIGEALNIEIDSDSPIFREIEEYIVTMYKEMNDNKVSEDDTYLDGGEKENFQ